MTMMPPGTKIDGLNGGLDFQGAPAHSNLTARQLIDGPAAAQLDQSVQQTVGRQHLLVEMQDSQDAAAEARRFAANAKLGALAALDKQHPLKALREIAAKPEITSNTGYVLG